MPRTHAGGRYTLEEGIKSLVGANNRLTEEVRRAGAIGIPAGLVDDLRLAREESARLTIRIRDLTAERDGLIAVRDDLQARLAAMTTDRDRLQHEYVLITAQLAALRVERDRINIERGRITVERDAALHAHAQAEVQNCLLTTQVTALTGERDDLARRMAEMQRERLLVDQALAAAQGDLRNMRNERDRLAAAQANLEAQRAALELGLAQAEAAKATAEQAAETEKARYTRLDLEHQGAKARLAELESNRAKFAEERRQQTDQIKVLQAEISVHKADLERLTTQVREINDVMQDIAKGQPLLVKAFANPYEALSSIVAPLLSSIGYDLKTPGDFTKVMQAAASKSSRHHTAAKEALAKLESHFGILPTTNIGEVMNVLGQMAEAQLVVDPLSKRGVKEMAVSLNALRVHPYIEAAPDESLTAAADRGQAETKQTEKVKKAMMGAGFLAIERPYDSLDTIGQVISADGIYGRRGGEKQIPVKNITEIVGAVLTLFRKEDAAAKALLGSIAAGMGVEVEQLPRVVKALMPMAVLTEVLKGSGTVAEDRRDIFNELKEIKVNRPRIKTIGHESPKGEASLSPIIGDTEHPDLIDTLFAYGEMVRRNAEELHASGKISRSDVFAALLKEKCGQGLTRNPSFG